MADNYLITGYWGEPHVTTENDRGINAAIFGAGRYVLPVGEQFRAEYVGNNTIRIYDGKLVDNGAAGGIPAGQYVDVLVANASQGMNRNDLIVFQYEQDTSTLKESGTFVVIQGNETEGTAEDPTLKQEDLLSGFATFDQMALWRIPITSAIISTPVQLFEVSKSLDKAGTGNIVVDAVSSDGVSYTATVEDLEELYNGLEITIIPNIDSTTKTPTLNVNGLGAKPIRLSLSLNNSVLVQPKNADYYAAGIPVQLIFDSKYLTSGVWRVSNKQRPSAEDLYGTTPVPNGGTGRQNITPGNFLVGNGEEPMEEKTPTEVMEALGGVCFDLLWENASPTSEFATQTITVPGLSDYNMILIMAGMVTEIMFVNNEVQLLDGFLILGGSNDQSCARRVTPRTNNEVEFKDCYTRFSTTMQATNDTLIPQKIYGIKGG